MLYFEGMKRSRFLCKVKVKKWEGKCPENDVMEEEGTHNVNCL